MEKVNGVLSKISIPLNSVTGRKYKHRHILLLIIPGTQRFQSESVYLLLNSREWKTHVVYGVDLLHIGRKVKSHLVNDDYDDISDIDSFFKDPNVWEAINEEIRHEFRLPDGSFELKKLDWTFIRVKYSPRWKTECVYIHFGYQLIIYEGKSSKEFRKLRPYNGKFKWYTYDSMKKETNMMYRASDLISYLFSEDTRLDLLTPAVCGIRPDILKTIVKFFSNWLRTLPVIVTMLTLTTLIYSVDDIAKKRKIVNFGEIEKQYIQTRTTDPQKLEKTKIIHLISMIEKYLEDANKDDKSREKVFYFYIVLLHENNEEAKAKRLKNLFNELYPDSIYSAHLH